MNLTYEVKENGYTILNNGVAWIVQEGFIPYPGATMEEAAQNHINELTKETNQAAEEENKLNDLEERLALTEQMLMEMMLEGGNA